MINFSQIGEREPTNEYPELHLKHKIIAGKYIKFFNIDGKIVINSTGLDWLTKDYYRKLEKINPKDLLNDLLLLNAERGNHIYDVFKSLPLYCEQYLNVDSNTVETQVKALKRKGIKIQCGHRFDIKNAKHFLSNHWTVYLSIVFYDISRVVKDKETGKRDWKPGYNYDYPIILSITKKEKYRRSTISRLHKEYGVQVGTLAILYRMSRMQIYNIINGES